jgi:hypothetical protein
MLKIAATTYLVLCFKTYANLGHYSYINCLGRVSV